MNEKEEVENNDKEEEEKEEEEGEEEVKKEETGEEEEEEVGAKKEVGRTVGASAAVHRWTVRTYAYINTTASGEGGKMKARNIGPGDASLLLTIHRRWG